MAKNKRKAADRAQTKKVKMKTKKMMNPFEVHVNKEKLRVLGKKQKNDRGLPGVAKAKAIEKRKRTLLQEYQVLNKSNKFLDKRIGERNQVMSNEEKAMARYTAVRVKAHNKKSIFNLADDEILTHRGQTLSEIEKFDDPRSEDEDSADEGTTGKLDREFVKDAHFGGGVLKRTGLEGAKTHKELIDQLIAESKKRKAEKRKAKEDTLELTEKLDTDWKDLLPLVNKSKKADDQADKTKIDDYDKIMRELKFEARGTVSNRLKSEDELAKEEKEKLEELEKGRLERMKGFLEEKSIGPTHRSADDLDDDFVFESDPDYMLSYNDKGEANVKVDVGKSDKRIDENSSESEGEGDSDGEEVETDVKDDFSDLRDDSESESETEAKAVVSKTKKSIKETAATEGKDIKETGRMQLECNEAPRIHKETDLKNNFTNLRDDSRESESEAKGKENFAQTEKDLTEDATQIEDIKAKKIEYNDDPRASDEDPSDKQSKEKELKDEMIVNDLLKRKEIMEKARAEVPFIFTFPDSYQDFLKIIEHEPTNHQSVIVERIIKCNHPSLAEKNKRNMELLFAYLLQYMNDIFTDVDSKGTVKKSFEIFKALIPQIYDAAQLSSETSHNSMLEVINEKYRDFKGNVKRYPADVETLVFLKLISILFTTSDFRHQIVTPCFVLIEEMLNNCRVRTKRDVSYGLFLATLVLEFTALSKRYLPAVINFLVGLLHMAIPKTGVRLIKIPPPFKSISTLLVLVRNDDTSENIGSLKMDCTDLIDSEIDEDFKIRVLYNTLRLLEEYYKHFQDLASRIEIFEPVLKYLELLPASNYPREVKTYIADFWQTLRQGKATRALDYIMTEAKKPKALRLYEPKIEEVYDGKRFKVQSKRKADRDKLKHKLKKETKGALREIRRDKAFLGRVKIHKIVQSDKERREKVNRLYAEAAMQQSELNEMDRKRKRKR